MNKIICIGSATKDIFFPTNEGVILETPEDATAQRKISFELGAKYHIGQRHETMGGCAVNVAVGLARLGLRTACYVPIGEDVAGAWVTEGMAKEGVDTSSVKKIAGAATDLSAIIVDEASGERTIFSNHDASQKFQVEAGCFGEEEWVFVGDLSGDWQGNTEAVFAKAGERGMKIAFNPRQQMLHDDVKTVIGLIGCSDLLFVNKDEAIEIVQGVGKDCENINDEAFLLESLGRLGCAIVVLTDGLRGAWVLEGGRLSHAEVFLQKAVDTTGSGDAFASGFLGALLKGKTIDEALKWGIMNSSGSVKEYGGQKGLMNEEEISGMIGKVEVMKSA